MDFDFSLPSGSRSYGRAIAKEWYRSHSMLFWTIDIALSLSFIMALVAIPFVLGFATGLHVR